jgi:hypothetical protein
MDRQGKGAAQRTGYSMERNNVTRSQMQILADLLNEPENMAEWDAGAAPDKLWEYRIYWNEADQRFARANHADPEVATA